MLDSDARRMGQVSGFQRGCAKLLPRSPGLHVSGQNRDRSPHHNTGGRNDDEHWLPRSLGLAGTCR
jgi:hypothetical protein